MNSAGLIVYEEETEYDAFDRLVEKTFEADDLTVSQKYEYNVKNSTTGNRVSDYIISYNHGQSVQNISFTYTYDGNGNITSIEEVCNDNSYDTVYTYDEAGQLKTVYDEKTRTKSSYCYDEYGNIVYEEIRTINNIGRDVLEDWTIYTYDGLNLVRSNSYAYGVIHYKTDSDGNVSRIYRVMFFVFLTLMGVLL